MNPNTGEVYRTREEKAGALARGEPLVPIAAGVADLLDDGRKWQARRDRERRRNKARRASRKRNRA